MNSSRLPSRPLPTRAVAIAAAVLGAALLSGCSTIENLNPFSGDKYETKILPDVPADDVYNQGVARLDKKATSGAAKKFSQREKDYPYSDWSRKGLLMETFAQYQGGEYDDEIQSGSRYAQLYPNTPDAPYALYLQAMSYYNQVPDISRDQQQSAKALDLSAVHDAHVYLLTRCATRPKLSAEYFRRSVEESEVYKLL